MYKIRDIAKYIINLGMEESKKDGTFESQITNIRLQIILYICKIIYFKTTKQLLFNEGFIATPIGPKNEEIYNTYCGFGGISISVSLSIPQEIAIEDKLIIDPIVSYCISLCKNDFWSFYKTEKLGELEACYQIYNKYGSVEIPFSYTLEIDGDRIYEKYRRA